MLVNLTTRGYNIMLLSMVLILVSLILSITTGCQTETTMTKPIVDRLTIDYSDVGDTSNATLSIKLTEVEFLGIGQKFTVT